MYTVAASNFEVYPQNDCMINLVFNFITYGYDCRISFHQAASKAERNFADFNNHEF